MLLTKKIGIRMPIKIYTAIQKIAKEEDATVTRIIVRALQGMIDRYIPKMDVTIGDRVTCIDYENNVFEDHLVAYKDDIYGIYTKRISNFVPLTYFKEVKKLK